MENRDVLIKEISENIMDYYLVLETGDFLLDIVYNCYSDEEAYELFNEAVELAKKEYKIRYGRELKEV